VFLCVSRRDREWSLVRPVHRLAAASVSRGSRAQESRSARVRRAFLGGAARRSRSSGRRWPDHLRLVARPQVDRGRVRLRAICRRRAARWQRVTGSDERSRIAADGSIERLVAMQLGRSRCGDILGDPSATHHSLKERIAGQPVCTVQACASSLTACPRPSMEVRPRLSTEIPPM